MTHNMAPLASLQEPKLLYLVGANISHAISNTIHNEVAISLDSQWRLQGFDNAKLSDFLPLMRSPSFAGAVITMPHKLAIMTYLDRVDSLASLLGACNNVYRDVNGDLVGTNTDWIGVRDSLLCICGRDPSAAYSLDDVPRKGKAAVVVGAGGAARAAIYALDQHLGASTIYIINRDSNEVATLIRDITDGYKRMELSPPRVVYLRSKQQAQSVDSIYYAVGTVPDFTPVTEGEIVAAETFDAVLSTGKGVFLDMCYKPRYTRSLVLARRHGWVTVEGTEVVVWQLKTQWSLWAGKEVGDRVPFDLMRRRVSELTGRLDDV